MDTQLPETIAPAGPPSAAKVVVPGSRDDPKPKAVKGKLKVALDLMIYGDDDGNPCEWNEAAVKAKFSTRAMRLALEKGHVQRYLKVQKDVFRKSVSASNILHARRIRNASGNAMASLGAIKLLEQIGEQKHSTSVNVNVITPGVMVDLTAKQVAPLIDHQEIIELNPLEDQGDVGHDV